MGRDVPPPSSLPALGTLWDPDTVRVTFRLTGVVLMAIGVVFLLIFLLDFLPGSPVWTLLAVVLCGVLLICGLKLWTQRYSAGPDTARRSIGIVNIGFGANGFLYPLQIFLRGTAGAPDWVVSVIIFNLAAGSVALIVGVFALRSRRYSAWFQRKWEKGERRRAVKLRQAR